MKVSGINYNLAFGKRYLRSKSGSQVFLKNGIAYDFKGAPYSGEIIYTAKSGNKWELEYSNGLIKRTSKNNEKYKEYYYSRDYNEDFELKHKFEDTSELPESEFYDNSDKATISICPFEGDQNFAFYIMRKKGAMYLREPFLYIVKQNGEDGKISTYVLSQGKEKFEFKSVQEAEEYFKSEYGIDAEFGNLAQAHLVKYAVDDFIRLPNNPYKKHGKKLFSGLKIRQETLAPDNPARYCCSFQCRYSNGELLDKANHLQEWQDYVDFILQNRPDSITSTDERLLLNRDYDWSNKEIAVYGEIVKHSSTRTLKGYIHHELGHYFYQKYSSFESIIYGGYDADDAGEIYKENSKKIFSDRDYSVMAMVSDYAKTNGNEFVAEYIAGRMGGKIYPKEVDSLYRKIGGIQLF